MNEGITVKEKKEMKEKIKNIKVKPDSKPKDKKKKETTASKIKDLKEEVKNLTEGVKELTKENLKSDDIIKNLRIKVSAISSNLNLHINKKTAQIRVFEKANEGGKRWKWSGYTGVFYINAKDHQKRIVKKALDHYEQYFKDDDFYKNRTLGLFTTNAKGQKLVRVLQDNENKLKKNGKKINK